MRTLVALPGLLAAAIIMHSHPGHADPSVFVGLGDLQGGTWRSFAFSISADGSTVVGQSTSASADEAYRWTWDEGMVGLGSLPGGDSSSWAENTSADGSVVVGWSSIAGGNEAFRWTSGGGMVGLGDLPGGLTGSEAEAVSADGSVIVGWSSSALDEDVGLEAFRWTSGEGMVGLGDLPGGTFYSLAYDVSADGSTIVGRANGVDDNEAFIWTSGTGMVGLGFLPGGGFSSSAYGISADGSTVVGRNRSAEGSEAFIWTSAGGMVGLGDFPGGMFQSIATGVSADGSTVVGQAESESGLEAFIWDATNGMRELDVVLTELGLDLTDWELTNTMNAVDISDDGLAIAGMGYNPSHTTEGWRAVLPVPLVIELVEVDDPGNSPDATGYGAVSHAYSIGKFEVTNAEYAAFLNAVDPDGVNALQLYKDSMGEAQSMGGIGFDSESVPSDKYAPLDGASNKPVNYVTWFDAARFVNWLENGQPRVGGGTETGAYDLALAFPVRAARAAWALPTFDEWYKAAFYDPVSAGADALATPDYWLYPTGTDSAACEEPPGTTDSINCSHQPSELKEVGAYASAASHYGTFDQAGNVSEWTESEGTLVAVDDRLAPGGNLYYATDQLQAPAQFAEVNSGGMELSFGAIGFRVVQVPEPTGAALRVAALLMLGVLQVRRRSR